MRKQRSVLNRSSAVSFGRAIGTAGLSATVALCGCMIANSVAAQDAELGREAAVLEEVIVTATRRDTKLLDVPQAITALTGDFLIESGMDSLSQFAGMVPGLNFTERGPGKVAITVRGVSADPGTSSVSTVGIYIDEVALTNDDQNSQADFRTFDLERVEVLRGPQGTLYGEGAMGGVLRYITNKPDPTQFEASLDLSAGSIHGGDNEYAANAMLNFPIVEDKLAVRLVGLYRDQGGYIDNPQIGANDFNSAEIKGARVAAVYNATDRLKITAMGIFSRIDVDGDNITRGGGESEFIAAALNPRKDDYDLYSLTVNYAADAFNFSSITAYTERDSIAQNVDSELAVQFFVVPFSAPFSDVIPESSTFVFDETNDNVTQEFRFVSSTNSPFQWTAGLWYRDGDNTNVGSRQVLPVLTYGGDGDLSSIGIPLMLGPNPLGGPLGEPIPGSLHTDPFTTSFENRAVFGEVSYDFTEQWQLLVGARYFKETRGTYAPVGTGIINEFSGLFGPLEPTDDEFDITATTPKVTVSYSPNDDSLTYFTYASGVRSGGRNGQIVTVRENTCPEFYDEDSTNNFEIGGNTRSLGGRLTLSGAAFYTKWEDLQVLFFDPTTFASCVDNAGTAHTAGLELELNAVLAEGLTLGLVGNYIEAELDEDIPGADSPTSVIPEGTRLPNVPKYKIGATLQYVWPWFSEWDGYFNANVSSVGDSTAALEPGLRGNLEQPSYTIANLRFGVQNSRWGYYLYVNNLTDEYAVFADDTFGGIHRNQPRTIGVNIRAYF